MFLCKHLINSMKRNIIQFLLGYIKACTLGIRRANEDIKTYCKTKITLTPSGSWMFHLFCLISVCYLLKGICSFCCMSCWNGLSLFGTLSMMELSATRVQRATQLNAIIEIVVRWEILDRIQYHECAELLKMDNKARWIIM